MEIVIPVLIGLLIGGGVYMMLSRALIRMIVGMSLISYGINLSILIAGNGFTLASPPLLDLPGPHGDPVPQALILTAIVIGFALFAFLLVLGYRAYQELDADNTDTMRLAEPPDAPRPPLSY